MLRTVVLFGVAVTSAFHSTSVPSTFRRPATLLRETNEDTGSGTNAQDLESFLAEKYPAFHGIVSLNESIWKTLKQSKEGCTVFAPNAQAFEDLGEKKQLQLNDPRNVETAEKVALFHIIGTEAVTSERLRREDWTVPKVEGKPALKVGGVVTLGGEVPVGRSKSGGFLGIGAKEDGGVTVGPGAKIIQSFNVGPSIVHEVDAFVSPQVLWRYMDQLRIPGF